MKTKMIVTNMGMALAALAALALAATALARRLGLTPA